ncbi:MAG: Jag N-terminal domain-containing protein [Thermodesulfobacteriota bacterium]|nr:Jag N-terminal domain-containing protein [Thermodesulfobacteriota bacterium]
MAKGKDFYGKDVTEVIANACKEMSASQEDLDIEVLETGSAGIFGLCKKKAHIRVTRKVKKGAGSKKKTDKVVEPIAEPVPEVNTQVEVQEKKEESARRKDVPEPEEAAKKEKQASARKKKAQEPSAATKQPVEPKQSAQRELPSDEVLATIEEDISELLTVMGFSSDVTVEIVDYSVACKISGEHQEALVGSDGRTLDSLQYLLRKIMSSRLPDRMMLSLDVGDYRERRALELKERALELAEQVKADGKTQAIAALNPSERREVHMILQDDKAIRSRSVGEGLFKKVLIYKPGKKNKSGSRKGKGRQGGRSSGNK